MGDRYIPEVLVVVADMRPVVSNLVKMTPHLQQRPRRPGLRPPGIKRDRLPLVSDSSIAEMRLFSQ
jgi:hypothetical protein